MAAGSVRRHPDYEDLVAHWPQARALQGRPVLRAWTGSGGISSWRVPCRSQARQLPAAAGPRRQGGALSVLRRVPVDRRRERALFDHVGVHAFPGLAQRPHHAGRHPPQEPPPDKIPLPPPPLPPRLPPPPPPPHLPDPPAPLH